VIETKLLDTNPCKMCMPLGGAIALKGIEKSMMIFHGSQGCSVYIRRHLSTHFNEPIDIASSSIDEIGTIYGGEENLKKALRNVERVYNPKVIGVMTTCLAETIGEDISKIIKEYKSNHISAPFIIPITSNGLIKTQFEGYFITLLSVLKGLSKKSPNNKKINIIVPILSPADIRNIKEMLNTLQIEYILFPDYSDILDAPYERDYKRLPDGGTEIKMIEQMSGAQATLEISEMIDSSFSPGEYLRTQFGIPLYRCPIPIGIKNTDMFLQLIKHITGLKIPEKMKRQRAMLIDAMIDAHKINSEGNAVIYGDPELLNAMVYFAKENGISVLIAATGAENSLLKEKLINFVDGKILDSADFTDIERIVEQNKERVNLLIGNSNGAYISEKYDIPLVRIGFPIHDRLGGQRVMLTGYNGSISLIDNISNVLLDKKHRDYRKSIYNSFYKNEHPIEVKINKKSDNNIIDYHPCFSEKAALKYARIHLPVISKCNISCNYCNRKYNCINESRPGVTSKIMDVKEAEEAIFKAKQKYGENLKIAGIAGPGDALADFSKTKQVFEMLKDAIPDIVLCMSTNGLMLPFYADELIKLGLQFATITINTVNSKIGSRIYKYVDYFDQRYDGEKGAEILIKNQLEGLKYLSSHGIICKVNTIVINSINDEHIDEVIYNVKENGAYIVNLMPLIPLEGTPFESMKSISKQELIELRKKYSNVIKQMYHCKQCRADAMGYLNEGDNYYEKEISDNSFHCSCINE